MAINVSQSFHRTSANAIDDTLTLTKAQMLAINDNLMPSKYLTICQEDGKIYLYDKAATPNVETGKFSVFEGGESLPSGGTTGQLLAKKSSTDGDVEWKTVEGLDPVQVDELPEASADELGKIYQYVGSHPIDIEYTDDTSNFVGEGDPDNYSIAKNDLQLHSMDGGYGMIKCKTPLVNRGTLKITHRGNTGVASYAGMYLGSTMGGSDIYTSPSWNTSTTAVTDEIDLSQFDNEEIYVSFRINVASGNRGFWYITSMHHEAEDAHTNGYFYKCKSKDEEGTTVYSWDEIPVQEIPDVAEMPAEDMAEVASPLPSVMSRRFKYSTEEQVVAEWIDGKPLYQKTIIDTTAKTGSFDIDISSLNVEYVNIIEMLLMADDGNGGIVYTPNPTTFSNSDYWFVNMLWRDKIQIEGTNARITSRADKGYILTIQYTKTTV